ncbi:MAG: phenylalanine--tRNA ligase subunit beta [Deltaproteobacteria bacterium]|nr:phenylalanine--tRNA ligase subunit beta [Deltaproteobacteria bacterium]
MRVAVSWLEEWIGLPPVEALCERLTTAGIEIEGVERTGPDLSGVRVGHVVAREKHPDADKLSLCRVDVGEGEPLEIVCGAPNVAAGQRVAVALVGVDLPGGLRIKKSKIRGVVSNGMICSARELGLGESHDGILVLDASAPVGRPLPEVLRTGDTVLDFELTPNRGDWASMLGIAREVRALFGGELRFPQLAPRESGDAAAKHVRVAIEDRAGCSRYAARVVRGVRVAPSPKWVVDKLEAAGVRSVNNVVDVTNLVMLELGQPLHAFDLDRVRGTVRVRAAKAGEKLRTLDGQDRTLEAGDLAIADDSGAIALAGVMGGAESEVHEGTTNVLLESAHFDPRRVRKTARRLGLHSEASYRFERGVDPDGQARAADRAALLLAELAGGSVAPGVVEALGEPVRRASEISLDPARANRLLGTQLSASEMIALLARVDVAAEPAGALLRCKLPRYRGDLAIPEDLIEEIARIHGYDAIPATLPPAALEGTTLPPRRATLDAARASLVASGLTELMTFVGVDAAEHDALRLAPNDPRRACVRIANPIHASDDTLRTQLTGTVLRIARANLARQASGLRVFEIWRVFRKGPPGELPSEPLEAVALITAGDAGVWDRAETPPFFQAKAIAERLLADLGHAVSFSAGECEPFLHPGAAGSFSVAGKSVVRVGELHPEVAAAFEIATPCALVVADVEALDGAKAEPPKYREVSKHPRVVRDIALLLGRDTAAGSVIATIRRLAGASLTSVTVFDRYEGKGVPEGKLSLAFRLVFQRTDRTLTEQEIAKTMERVVNALKQELGAELR